MTHKSQLLLLSPLISTVICLHVSIVNLSMKNIGIVNITVNVIVCIMNILNIAYCLFVPGDAAEVLWPPGHGRFGRDLSLPLAVPAVCLQGHTSTQPISGQSKGNRQKPRNIIGVFNTNRACSCIFFIIHDIFTLHLTREGGDF